MEQTRKMLAAVCAVLFFISTVLALLMFNIDGKAFDSATYKQAFEKRHLYERTPAILAGAIHARLVESPNADPYLKSLTAADWEGTISTLLPPEELRAITDRTLDSVFEYVNGKTDSVTISLLPFKSHLVGPSGVEAIMQILNTQPDCTLEQLMQMGMGLVSGEIGLCKPPEEMLGLVTPLIESQLQFMVTAFPDEITLDPGTQNGLAGDPRPALKRIRTVMQISPVFPFLFLLGVTVFGVRSLRDWLRWWGYPFLAAGATGALIALVGSPILGWLMERVLQNLGAGFIPAGLLLALTETVNAVAGQILQPVIVEGLILAVLGLGMVIVSTVLKRKA